MNYSQLLAIPCEFDSACTAAGVPVGSPWGSVVIALMERIESLTKVQSEAPTAGFRPVPRVSADSILRQLSQEKLFVCDQCAEKIDDMLRRWKLSGIIAPADDSADTEQAAKRIDAKLLQ